MDSKVVPSNPVEIIHPGMGLPGTPGIAPSQAACNCLQENGGGTGGGGSAGPPWDPCSCKGPYKGFGK